MLTLLYFAIVAVDAPDFGKDVLPIFEKYCFGCHATGIRMGSFECDTYEGVMRGATHGAVVVPGKSAESRLYQSLTGELSPAMPMSLERLTATELSVIRRWIDTGAKPGLKKDSAKEKTRANLESWQFRTSNVTGSPARPARSPR